MRLRTLVLRRLVLYALGPATLGVGLGVMPDKDVNAGIPQGCGKYCNIGFCNTSPFQGHQCDVFVNGCQTIVC